MDFSAVMDFENVLVKAISAADSYSQRSDSIVHEHANNVALNSMYEKTNYGAELISGAHSYAQSGFNAFQTLRLAVLPNGMDLKNPDGKIQAKFTITGVAGLLRQSIECLVRAQWLLEAKGDRQIDERGYALLWSNCINRLKYERALDSTQVPKFEKLRDKIRAEGISLQLFDTSSAFADSYSLEPRIKIADASGLLRNIVTDVPLPTELTQVFGNGFKNAEWVYIWLSGITHGLEWSHKGKSEFGINDVAVFYRTPDFQKFATAACYVLQIGQNIFRLASNPLEVNDQI